MICNFFCLQFRLPYLTGQRDKPRLSQKWDFFLSQINYVNNSSLSRDVSNNFRSNFSNKLQVNDIPERR